MGFVVNAAEGFPAHHRLLGRARFLDALTLAVGDDTVQARAVVIATGSRPKVLPFLADLGDRLVVNDDVFDWQDLPESVAVFGPGVIGLEIGQALARLGVRVRIFGVGGFVGPLTDPEVKAEATRVIGAEVPLYPDAQGLRAERADGGVRVHWIEDGAARSEVFQYALAATGRVPNVDGLGLDTTGLPLDRRGVPVYDPRTLQAGASHIFIAGDANADLPLLHEAADEGKIAGDNAARFPEVRPGHRRTPLSVVFSDPNIAMIGESWAQVKDRNPIVGRVSFDD
ncbi:MAG: FAD-dependent oxidoreductase, partial [Myxococcota bacterium]